MATSVAWARAWARAAASNAPNRSVTPTAIAATTGRGGGWGAAPASVSQAPAAMRRGFKKQRSRRGGAGEGRTERRERGRVVPEAPEVLVPREHVQDERRAVSARDADGSRPDPRRLARRVEVPGAHACDLRARHAEREGRRPSAHWRGVLVLRGRRGRPEGARRAVAPHNNIKVAAFPQKEPRNELWSRGEGKRARMPSVLSVVPKMRARRCICARCDEL